MVKISCASAGIFLIFATEVTSLKVLRVLRIMPFRMIGFGGDDPYMVPMEMAADDINRDPNILPGFNFTLDYVDSECNGGIAAYRTLQALYNKPPFLMLLGPDCSPAAQAIASQNHLWNLTLISNGGTARNMANRTLFPKFFRMGTPDFQYNMARIGLLKRFNWKKIATIHQASDFFSEAVEDFSHTARQNNINIITQEIFLYDLTSHVHNLKAHDARIIFVFLYASMSRQLLCAAYKAGLYGPKIVWIFPGWYPDNFWTHAQVDGCSTEQLALVVEGAFLIKNLYYNTAEERGVANITASEFLENLHGHPRYTASYKPYEFLADILYDHVWVSAMALNCTMGRLADLGHNKTLDMFEYTDADMNEVIFECSEQTSILGISGRISLSDNSSNARNVMFQRVQGGGHVNVGFLRQDETPHYYEWYTHIRWKDGKIPRDSTHVTYKEVVFPETIYAILCTLAGVGMVIATSFFLFNLYHRETRSIKMSSPNINNLLLLGCQLTYFSTFFKMTETDVPAICMIRLFTFATGVTVVFGCLFSKTWCAHRIFTDGEQTNRSVNERQLYTIVGILVAVVLVVIIIWEIVAPHIIVVRYMVDEIYQVGNDEEVHPFVRVCYSEYATQFGWSLYVAEGTVLSFCAFLAFETRKVQVEALNDSHLFGLCIYNAFILSAAGLTLSVLLEQQVVMLYGVTSGCLIIGATITQCMIFVPKVQAIVSLRAILEADD